jgi:hypothetical protein
MRTKPCGGPARPSKICASGGGMRHSAKPSVPPRVANQSGVRPRIINLSDYVTDDDEGERQAIRERMADAGIRTDPYGNWLP